MAGLALGMAAAGSSQAATEGFLDGLRHQRLVGSTIPGNGDLNPYAVVVSPVTRGKLVEGHVLVDNFNDKRNLQGLGSTIVSIDPASGQLSEFAAVPKTLTGCPGGIGLTTAMTVLRSGWVIVGSLPSQDGTTRTKGPGCLVVLDANGAVAGTIAGEHIDGPWGNMAAIDRGDTASLFVSNTGFGVGAPGQDPVRRATVLRLDLRIPAGGKPELAGQTVIADGLAEQADASVFIVGPTGLALGGDGTLYVSDAIGNRVVAIADAEHRTGSAGPGREVTRDGLLRRPLAMVMAPNGNLLATNGLNGQVVEIDPANGRQLAARWLDTDRAQTPPGSGDLFGLAIAPGNQGLYFVEDDVNTLVHLR